MADRLPLQGIRVLDITQFMAGPYCTRMLAELGAEVFKVEPVDGEQLRYRAPLRNGRSTYFAQLNAGKKSVALDLRHPEGSRAARDIAVNVDVLVQNYRPGVLDRLGLGYEELSARNPALIYCCISGYGPTGARSGLPAYAQIIGADSGFDMASLSYQRDQSAPAATGIFVADSFTGGMAFGAVMTALYKRQTDGQGTRLDVSIFDTMMSTMVYETQTAQHGSQHSGLAYRPSKTKDGFVTVTPISESNFANTLNVIGRPELKTDPRFAATGAREAHWDELQEIVEDWTKERTSAEAVAAFRRERVPCARYRTVAEVLEDPEVLEGGTFRPVTDDAGSYLIGALPFKVGGTQPRPEVTTAELGEHTIEALTKIAGYSADDAASLIAEGAARARDTTA